MCKLRPYILSVAGFDPSAGAGVLADCKTFENIGVYGLAAITANTIQNDSSFYSANWIDVKTATQQCQTLLESYKIDFVKIGLVESISVLKEIIDTIRNNNPNAFIIWDPILASSSGYHFHDSNSFDLGYIVQNINLITPNRLEFDAIFPGKTDALSYKNIAILLKGGHNDNPGTDTLFLEGEKIEISGSSFNGKSKHGTGCVLSAAIAAYLALGDNLESACRKAKTYVEQFIQSNESNLGYHNANPIQR